MPASTDTYRASGNPSRPFPMMGRLWVVAIVAVMCSLGVWVWQQQRDPTLRWANTRTDDAGVLSMAAGRDSRGEEIVVTGGFVRTPDDVIDGLVTCHEVRDGRLRWEIMKPGEPSAVLTTIQVAVDPFGDVLVGWSASFRGADAEKFFFVDKYSGVDGTLIWTWKPPQERQSARQVMIPVPDDAGNVWIGWNRKTVAADEGRAVVTVLDGSTGREKWTASLSRSARQESFRPGSLRMLEGGDAILMLVHSDREACRIQRVSGVDGEVLWEVAITGVNRYQYERTSYWVDERNARVLLLWKSNNPSEWRVGAACLATGKPIWDEELGPEIGSDFKFSRLGKRGDLELWSGSSRTKYRIAWDQWTDWHGIPHPRRNSNWEHGSLQVVLAGVDGSERSRKFVKDKNFAHRLRLEYAGQATRETHRLMGTRIDNTYHQWPLDARRWFAEESMPGEPARAYRVIHSPSGKLILARQSWRQHVSGQSHQWELQMWD